MDGVKSKIYIRTTGYTSKKINNVLLIIIWMRKICGGILVPLILDWYMILIMSWDHVSLVFITLLKIEVYWKNEGKNISKIFDHQISPSQISYLQIFRSMMRQMDYYDSLPTVIYRKIQKIRTEWQQTFSMFTWRHQCSWIFAMSRFQKLAFFEELHTDDWKSSFQITFWHSVAFKLLPANLLINPHAVTRFQFPSEEFLLLFTLLHFLLLIEMVASFPKEFFLLVHLHSRFLLLGEFLKSLFKITKH